MKNIKIKKILKILSIVILIFIVQFLAVDLFVISTANKYQIEVDQVDSVDCIIVPGAMVYPNGYLSGMLRDRLLTALDILKQHKGTKILVSGDNGSIYYNEVVAMKKFLVENGVPKQDVFMDHAGFSTYETAFRAKAIFQVKKAVIVTQEYHLKRAIYDGRRLGIEMYGVPSDRQRYANILKYEFRESLAIYKDFLLTNIFKPNPTFLGDEIPIVGNNAPL